MTDKENIRGHIRGQYAKAAKGEAQGCCSGECGCNGTATDISAVSKKLGYIPSRIFTARPTNPIWAWAAATPSP